MNDEPSKTEFKVDQIDDVDDDKDATPVEKMEDKPDDADLLCPFDEIEIRDRTKSMGQRPKGVIISNSADKKRLQADWRSNMV